jgi:cytochrome c553
VVAAVTGGAGSAETLVERGAYLVTTVAACGNCHTPRDASGKPMVNMALAGGFEFDDDLIGHVVVRNITPDPETGIGKWTDAEIVSGLRNGKRPDGTVIGPPMPTRFYRLLSDRDAAAIAAYLRSLKPISHEVGRTLLKNPLPPFWVLRSRMSMSRRKRIGSSMAATWQDPSGIALAAILRPGPADRI